MKRPAPKGFDGGCTRRLHRTIFQPKDAMTPIAAETLGLKALTWLAAQPDALAGFFSVSGLGAADLRARASEPDLLAAVIDHLLNHESLAMRFCENAESNSRDLHMALHVLGNSK